jgi:hypothetical protein
LSPTAWILPPAPITRKELLPDQAFLWFLFMEAAEFSLPPPRGSFPSLDFSTIMPSAPRLKNRIVVQVGFRKDLVGRVLIWRGSKELPTLLFEPPICQFIHLLQSPSSSTCFNPRSGWHYCSHCRKFALTPGGWQIQEQDRTDICRSLHDLPPPPGSFPSLFFSTIIPSAPRIEHRIVVQVGFRKDLVGRVLIRRGFKVLPTILFEYPIRQFTHCLNPRSGWHYCSHCRKFALTPAGWQISGARSN